MTGRKRHLFLLALVLLSFTAYFNVYGNGFVWDDEWLIRNNLYIRDPGYLGEAFTSPLGEGGGSGSVFYRPLQTVAYMGIYGLSELETTGFHTLNVSLHTLNAVLIFVFLSELAGRRPAFLASLLWTVHPLHTEAVTYMSGTADPLHLAFMLGSLILYHRFRDGGDGRLLAGSLSLFLLALLSKETALVLPLLLGLYIFLFDDGREIGKYRGLVPFAALAVVYLLFRLAVLDFGITGTAPQLAVGVYQSSVAVRLMTFLAALPLYYSLLVFPVNLHFQRSFPIYTQPFTPETALSITVLAGASLLFWKFRDSRPAASLGIGWFFLALIPFSGILPINAVVAEHWLYVPAVGAFLLAGLTLDRLLRVDRLKTLAILIAVLIVVSSASLTVQRNGDWEDPVTFYEDVLSYGPDAEANNNLGAVYYRRGELDRAEDSYRRALELRPDYADARYNLGLLYLHRNDTREAVRQMERVLELDPSYGPAHRSLADIYRRRGDMERAEFHEERWRETRPRAS